MVEDGILKISAVPHQPGLSSSHRYLGVDFALLRVLTVSPTAKETSCYSHFSQLSDLVVRVYPALPK